MNKFDFYQDVKCSIWLRQFFTIEAENEKEAKMKAKEFQDKDVSKSNAFTYSEFQFETEAVSADRGYDCAEIHADMLARGIKTYIAKRKSNSGKNGLFSVDDFSYNAPTGHETIHCPQ